MSARRAPAMASSKARPGTGPGARVQGVRSARRVAPSSTRAAAAGGPDGTAVAATPQAASRSAAGSGRRSRGHGARRPGRAKRQARRSRTSPSRRTGPGQPRLAAGHLARARRARPGDLRLRDVRALQRLAPGRLPDRGRHVQLRRRHHQLAVDGLRRLPGGRARPGVLRGRGAALLPVGLAVRSGARCTCSPRVRDRRHGLRDVPDLRRVVRSARSASTAPACTS